MNLIKLTLPMVFLFSLLTQCVTQETPHNEPLDSNEFGTLKGHFTDLNNHPVKNVSVALYENTALVQQTITDENGAFTIDSIRPKKYSLEAYERQHAYYTVNDLQMDAGEIKDLGTIQLGEPIIEVDLKPVIYLYPMETIDISVSLDYKGQLTHTYPKYQEGWSVTANPDGTLWDAKGMEYYALFWEGIPKSPIIPEDGFVIPGDQTVAFLEEHLALLGLNRREANEFIMFWLPQMENNPFNFIHFASDAYVEKAELIVSPAPETVIRVMMVTQPLQQHLDIPVQDLTKLKKERKGFTVVEWGGTVLQHSVKENS